MDYSAIVNGESTRGNTGTAVAIVVVASDVIVAQRTVIVKVSPCAICPFVPNPNEMLLSGTVWYWPSDTYCATNVVEALPVIWPRTVNRNGCAVDVTREILPRMP